MAALVLTGCGSSSEEDQLAWMQNWNSFANYEQKLALINTCFEQAGIKNMMEEMSSSQSKMFDECELEFIEILAENEGVTLDQDVIKANLI